MVVCCGDVVLFLGNGVYDMYACLLSEVVEQGCLDGIWLLFTEWFNDVYCPYNSFYIGNLSSLDD